MENREAIEDEEAGETHDPSESTAEPDQTPGLFWRAVNRGMWIGKWLGLSLVVVIPVYLIWVNYAGYRAKKQVLRKMNEMNLPTNVEDFKQRRTPDDPGENGAKYYQAAMYLANKREGPPQELVDYDVSGRELGKPLPEKLERPLSKFVSKNQMIFELLNRAREFDYYQYNLTRGIASEENLLSGQLTIGMFRAGDILAYRAMYQEMNGKPNRAATTLKHILQMLDSFQYDRSLSFDLVRHTELLETNARIRELLSRETLTNTALKNYEVALNRLFRHLDFETLIEAQLSFHAEYLKHIGVMTAGKIYNLEYYYRMNEIRYDLPFDVSTRPNNESYWSELTDILHLFSYRLHTTVAPGYYESGMASEMLDYTQIMELLEKNPQQAIDELRQSEVPGFSKTERHWKDLKGFAEVLMETQTDVRLTRLALQVEQFRLEHGRWPSDKEELDAEWFDDPFGEGPLKYRKLENGLVIYSVGTDGTDHRGIQKDEWGNNQDIAFRLFDPEVRGTGADLAPDAPASKEEQTEQEK